MNQGIRQIANFMPILLLAAILYLGLLWFLGVGLAATIFLCQLELTPESYLIGSVVGKTTLLIPLLICVFYGTRIWLKDIERRQVS